MKHTLTEARAELRALKACSTNEIVANYNNWMNAYMERLMNTTGRVHEVYLQCVDTLAEKYSESEDR